MKPLVTGRGPVAERVPSPLDIPERLTRRVVVERVRPEIDGGRFPIKCTVGEAVDVSADVFADGHDVLAAVLRDRPADTAALAERAAEPRSAEAAASAPHVGAWREMPMTLAAPGTDRWAARFVVSVLGWHEYQIVAWADRFLTWRRDVAIKAAAGQDVSTELLEGSLIVREAAARAREERSRSKTGASGDTDRRGRTGGPDRAPAADADWLLEQADTLSEVTDTAERLHVALGEELAALMAAYADRSRATASEVRRVWVDRERARFGAWYEMFPRSAGPDPRRSATFREAAHALSRIADLGFDIVYLPPIHPIGSRFRKGPNNAPHAGPGDPGSPWAIGAAEGGHTAIEPGLGTLEDFDAFRREAERLGLEVALDLAWQASPDHPWVEEHPAWFRHRPDGTIKYAENPPKKYQDIYPFDFESDDWPALWRELEAVARFWIDRGVRAFRVDNPHTKPFGFWEWLIGRLHARHPDVIFLSEAFTRPTVMRYLAKAGFTQSYTYFTWRNTKTELVEYFSELTSTEVVEYLRPNLFANTPDILPEYLQYGGRAAFQIRLVLAATLGASYGIYGPPFENFVGQAVRHGSEEYLDSEKYQVRHWDWESPTVFREFITLVNRARRENPALQYDHRLRFHPTDNEQLLFYSKTSPDLGNVILVVVNLDPHHTQSGWVRVPLGEFGIHPGESYQVHDLVTNARYLWHGESNYVQLDPNVAAAHIFRLRKRVKTERDFDYFF
jgi:starch synthase (maltosyl-transferring)